MNPLSKKEFIERMKLAGFNKTVAEVLYPTYRFSAITKMFPLHEEHKETSIDFLSYLELLLSRITSSEKIEGIHDFGHPEMFTMPGNPNLLYPMYNKNDHRINPNWAKKPEEKYMNLKVELYNYFSANPFSAGSDSSPITWGDLKRFIGIETTSQEKKPEEKPNTRVSHDKPRSAIPNYYAGCRVVSRNTLGQVIPALPCVSYELFTAVLNGMMHDKSIDLIVVHFIMATTGSSYEISIDKRIPGYEESYQTIIDEASMYRDQLFPGKFFFGGPGQPQFGQVLGPNKMQLSPMFQLNPSGGMSPVNPGWPPTNQPHVVNQRWFTQPPKPADNLQQPIGFPPQFINGLDVTKMTKNAEFRGKFEEWMTRFFKVVIRWYVGGEWQSITPESTDDYRMEMDHIHKNEGVSFYTIEFHRVYGLVHYFHCRKEGGISFGEEEPNQLVEKHKDDLFRSKEKIIDGFNDLIKAGITPKSYGTKLQEWTRKYHGANHDERHPEVKEK